MINEKRVRRMARMAAYESDEGDRDERICSSFRGDYITKQVLITFICSTIAFVILAGLYAVDNFESLIGEINQNGYQTSLRQFVLYYILFMAVMTAVTILIYSYRYWRARKRLHAFYHDLRQLSADYHRGKDNERV